MMDPSFRWDDAAHTTGEDELTPYEAAIYFQRKHHVAVGDTTKYENRYAGFQPVLTDENVCRTERG